MVNEYRSSSPSGNGDIEYNAFIDNPEIGTANLFTDLNLDSINGKLPDKTKVKIMGGPEYINGVRFYKVYANGIAGWISERLLLPAD